MKKYFYYLAMLFLVSCMPKDKVINSLYKEVNKTTYLSKPTPIYGTYKTTSGSILNLYKDDTFSINIKHRIYPPQKSSGLIIYNNNNNYLESYDSITSTYLNGKYKFSYDNKYTLDSIHFEISAPIIDLIENNTFHNNTPFCDEYPLYFIIGESWNQEYLFQKSAFTIPRIYKTKLLDSFNITIIPNLLCLSRVKRSQLEIETIYVFDEKINVVKVFLPDLTLERLTLLEMKNVRIEIISKNMLLLSGEKFIKIND